MKKDDTVFLRHILDAVKWIDEYTHGMDYDGFRATHLVQDGVIRQLEIIGEATRNLSKEFRDKYADIPWKDMAGMRDKLIHQYFGVDIAAVWDTIQADIPGLNGSVTKILE
ncbi:MAG: DUF86 domain-containing protein [Deltaproteobacteria bacterium]|nr:DUF86 domain-containing protein [Deltaproteobacteria bacterium]